MKTLLVSLASILTTASVACADHVILIRLSYKVILNPADGTRPPLVSDIGIDNAIAGMNAMLDSYGRGYRFIRVDPVFDVGGAGGFSRPSPSHYYGINMLDVSGSRQQMESDATSNQTLYAWNPSALNIYINDANGGGQCAFPNEQLIAIGDGSSDNDWLTLHEIGHFFDLCHTQGCPCGCCSTTGQTGECFTTPGNDGISDTLPDLACWGQSQIAFNHFGTFYSGLTASQQVQVDDTFFNIMSYRASSCGSGDPISRLTELQLDHWSNTALFVRAGVCDGRTLNVRQGYSGSSNGNSSFPYASIPSALSVANSGDILLLRSSQYPGSITISQPITLRTPRGVVARIGQ